MEFGEWEIENGKLQMGNSKGEIRNYNTAS